MKYGPGRMEILLTKLAFFFFGKSIYRSFADSLPLDGGERVLDFGCGMGTVAYYVAKRLPGGHLTCLDISERWLDICRKTLRGFGNVAIVDSDIPAPDGDGYDTVYCHFALHDLSSSELGRVIPALAGSLKTGGKLVFREPLKDTAKIGVIKRLMDQNGMSLKESRITDIPVMGNALESVYIKR
jgi:cyclopropane fatty-acyl-phospholipid synthase-like methyltransferase